MQRTFSTYTNNLSLNINHGPSTGLVRLIGLVCLSSVLMLSLATSAVKGAEVSPTQEEEAGQPQSQMVVLREAFHLVNTVGNEVWPGWTRSPMTVVIIEDDYEYLLNAPRNWKESGGFARTEQTLSLIHI